MNDINEGQGVLGTPTCSICSEHVTSIKPIRDESLQVYCSDNCYKVSRDNHLQEEFRPSAEEVQYIGDVADEDECVEHEPTYFCRSCDNPLEKPSTLMEGDPFCNTECAYSHLFNEGYPDSRLQTERLKEFRTLNFHLESQIRRKDHEIKGLILDINEIGGLVSIETGEVLIKDAKNGWRFQSSEEEVN